MTMGRVRLPHPLKMLIAAVMWLLSATLLGMLIAGLATGL